MTFYFLEPKYILISTLSNTFRVEYKRRWVNINGDVTSAFKLAVFLTENNHLVKFRTSAHKTELMKLKEYLEKHYEVSLNSENEEENLKLSINNATHSILKDIYEENNEGSNYDDELNYGLDDEW